MGHWYCEASITRTTKYKETIDGFFGKRTVNREREDSHFIKGRVLSFETPWLYVVTEEGSNPKVTSVYTNFYQSTGASWKDKLTVLRWVE